MEQNKKTESLKSRIVGVLKWGYEFTSIAGITQLRTTDYKISKWAWFMLATFGIILTGYTVTQCIQRYMAHESVTTIAIRSAYKLDFPSVTICNENRVHCRKLYDLIRNCTKVMI